MKKKFSVLIIAAVFALFTVSTSAQVETWEVTITNLTSGQPLAPVLLVSHDAGYKLFTPGKKAKKALVTLAETGNPAAMAERAMKRNKVREVATADAPTMPGHSVTLTISGNDKDYISMAAMLAATNDGFAGKRNMLLQDGAVYFANAWDAGSEVNSESAYDVPAIGGQNRLTFDAEKRIYIHSGIKGIAELDPNKYDWRNPVVMISINRVN